MPQKTLTEDHTCLRMIQDEYFQPFFRKYLELLKSHLKRIQVINHTGNPHHSYYTCGQDHDKWNPDWNPFQLLEQYCEAFGYDFLEVRDMVQEWIGRMLKCDSVSVRFYYDRKRIFENDINAPLIF